MAFDGFVKIENEWIPYGCKDEKITIYFGMNSITLPDGLDMLVAQSLGSSPSVSSMFKLTIELLQLVTKLGMLDVDDWIFNTMGTSLGIELQRLIVRAETHKQKRRNTHESRYCS